MKNTRNLWLMIAITAIIALAFSACDPNNGDQNCTTCGKLPCECPVDNTCAECGEDPCECTPPCENGHSFPNWTDPTCTEDGNSVRTCANCTQTDTRTTGYIKLGCEGEDVIPATCQTDGFTGTGDCIRCGEPVTGTVIPVDPTAHNFTGSWIAIIPETPCMQTRTCTTSPCTVTETRHNDDGCIGTTGLVLINGNTEVGINISLGLSVVCIPEGVTFIGGGAFTGCTSLTSILVPASVTSIGTQAFSHCENLETVTFAEGSLLEIIGGSAFIGCTSLTSIIIPASVTSMGNSVFINCINLETVTFLAIEPPYLNLGEGGQTMFNICCCNGGGILPSLTAIFVPADSVDAYKHICGECGDCEIEAYSWSEYAHLIQAIQ